MILRAMNNQSEILGILLNTDYWKSLTDSNYKTDEINKTMCIYQKH